MAIAMTNLNTRPLDPSRLSVIRLPTITIAPVSFVYTSGGQVAEATRNSGSRACQADRFKMHGNATRAANPAQLSGVLLSRPIPVGGRAPCPLGLGPCLSVRDAARIFSQADSLDFPRRFVGAPALQRARS